jgi:hypothetical protein
MSNTLFLCDFLPEDCRGIINEFVHGHKCLNGCDKCDVDMLYKICSKCSLSRPESHFKTIKKATICMVCKIETRMKSDASTHFSGWLDVGNRRKRYMANIPPDLNENIIELNKKLMKVLSTFTSLKKGNPIQPDCDFMALVCKNKLVAKKYAEENKKHAEENKKRAKKYADAGNKNIAMKYTYLTEMPELPDSLTHLYCYAPPEPPLSYEGVFELYVSNLRQCVMRSKSNFLNYKTVLCCGNPYEIEIIELRNQISDVYKKIHDIYHAKYCYEKKRI